MRKHIVGSLLGAVTVGVTLITPVTGAVGRAYALPATPAYWPQVTSSADTPTRIVAPGVTERNEVFQTVAGPEDTQILSVDLTVPGRVLRAVEAGDRVIDPADETVTSMGDRTGAIGGVNGEYFDIGATGQPLYGSIVNGQIVKSPPDGLDEQLAVLDNGTVAIGPQPFTGSISGPRGSHALTSVNTLADAANGGITEITGALGPGVQVLPHAETLITGTLLAGQLLVTHVVDSTAHLVAPPAGQVELLGSGASGQWLAAAVRRGDRLRLRTSVGGGDVAQLITAACILVEGGQLYHDPTGLPPSGTNPETAVGVSQDGRHVMMVTIDGRGKPNGALGVTPTQAAGYLQYLGAYDAVLLDGGGSTTLAARPSGGGPLAVVNTPSDGSERPVANGLFAY